MHEKSKSIATKKVEDDNKTDFNLVIENAKHTAMHESWNKYVIKEELKHVQEKIKR